MERLEESSATVKLSSMTFITANMFIGNGDGAADTNTVAS